MPPHIPLANSRPIGGLRRAPSLKLGCTALRGGSLRPGSTSRSARAIWGSNRCGRWPLSAELTVFRHAPPPLAHSRTLVLSPPMPPQRRPPSPFPLLLLPSPPSSSSSTPNTSSPRRSSYPVFNLCVLACRIAVLGSGPSEASLCAQTRDPPETAFSFFLLSSGSSSERAPSAASARETCSFFPASPGAAPCRNLRLRLPHHHLHRSPPRTTDRYHCHGLAPWLLHASDSLVVGCRQNVFRRGSLHCSQGRRRLCALPQGQDQVCVRKRARTLQKLRKGHARMLSALREHGSSSRPESSSPCQRSSSCSRESAGRRARCF